VSEQNPSPTPAPTPEPVPTPVPIPLAPVDLKQLLLPESWSLEQCKAEAWKVYFEDLVPKPPQIPVYHWLEPLALTIAGTEGGFNKVFGETTGWATYHHNKTGKLDKERLRRVRWIRPVLEMQVPKTKIYVNNHSMKPRQFGAKAEVEKKRLFITTGAELLYLISLVYIKPGPGLALATAYAPNGPDLREMLKKHGTTLLGP